MSHCAKPTRFQPSCRGPGPAPSQAQRLGSQAVALEESESLLFGGVGEAPVEADQLQTAGAILGGVPESQRPILLSSSSTAKAPAPPRDFGRGWRKRSSLFPPVARRSRPWRSKRATRPSGAGLFPANTEAKRAIGRPRSRIKMVSPCRTWSMRALSWFLVSVRVAVFI